MSTPCKAIQRGILRITSGGRHAQASEEINKPENPADANKQVLWYWHASVAKNTAAQFAIESELALGTPLNKLMLCNLDGDNIMLGSFPEALMSQAGHI